MSTKLHLHEEMNSLYDIYESHKPFLLSTHTLYNISDYAEYINFMISIIIASYHSHKIAPHKSFFYTI